MDASTVCGRWHSATMGNIHVQIQARRGLRRPDARIALGNGKHRRASRGRMPRRATARRWLGVCLGSAPALFACTIDSWYRKSMFHARPIPTRSSLRVISAEERYWRSAL
ncbi:hypothetical protein DVU_3328 [Nitratidesulfovibrio vulgaris str. Hildenborough]|uniref:Uncharacterized protein n=1 Tax=Nitratidesulfovibrio vulgaris (strain ATCC 29579 / DSM 644 / CCUG 34227 / NCIMB 8303 / VKM B-1760 / Hildenborough) TaxID=882 RepID=Q725U7_NITV2|nr:hypothetical protein DVU_3328 [Nitratidesulfovibrio vulgaris str. Hildenborough]ADP88215.1 hypothetical protein Deval_3074 [Nitratidesulfovibrio vulgaris RCH1]